MRNVGLDVKRLTGLLHRTRVDCTVVDGEDFEDHCLLRLVLRVPAKLVSGLSESRQRARGVTIKVAPPDELGLSSSTQTGQLFWISEEGLNLRGS